MDLEKKNKQSYQGYMYARLLAFSNGDLQAMFDKSDGFFRRQLVLTTKDKNAERIARILQENKVMIPMAYWQSKGLNKGGKKTQPDPYKWCKTTVQKILAQQEYCGDIINFKTYSKNFKNKKRLQNPEENWKIFKNVHEPIIDRNTFETVQKMKAKGKRRAPNPEHAEKNKMYARDISRKVRSAHRIRGNMGEPLSQPPYGYMKSPENKKKWIIDPEAAEVVRDIYRMCLEGMGNEAIAGELQRREILIPMAYWQSKGLNRGGKKTQANPYKWCKTTVQKILCQQEYCGDVINFKTYSKNFKNKTRIDNPVENWKIFKDVHEPIIDRDTWETVQKHTAQTKRRAPKKENARKHIFSGLIRCADCGSNMRYHTNTVNKDIHYFSCGNYVKDTRGTCPERHYIRADALEQIVVFELKRLAIMLQQDEDLLADILEKKTNKDFYDEKKHLEEQLQKAIVRQQTVASLYEKLYEDNVTGKVTDEWFTHMSHKYEVERAELKVKIFNLRAQVANIK